MNRSPFRSSSESSQMSCQTQMLSLVVFVTLFVFACWCVGTMINYWS